ncbi:MAG: MbcA/ParS/Xre antitoxin family protein [Legionella sp.]|nr:MbcA/ParS/Xre antitoxin family protein [Legionella sp.]
MSTAEKKDPSAVLATAIIKLKADLHIKSQDLGEMIGQHRNTVTRFLQKGTLDPKSKSGELALLLIRAYRALFALNGGNKPAMIHWLNTYNYHIQGVPLEEMKHVMGLSRVVSYLDAMRGKI